MTDAKYWAAVGIPSIGNRSPERYMDGRKVKNASCIAAGTVRVDGKILANGENSDAAGAGGSVRIDATSVTGLGEIHADGGEPGRVDRLGPTLPMQRGGEAIEVARAILWLLSDEASYSTGTFIDVAGGR